MSKILIYILLVLGLSLTSLYPQDNKFLPICSMTKAKKLLKKIPPIENRDKVKHCQMSCMLTLRCPAIDVYTFGLMKEFYDLFGPGDAEQRDLMANRTGIRFVTRNNLHSDEQCLEACANFIWQ